MPYGDDSELLLKSKAYETAVIQMHIANRHALRERLKVKFNVPDGFLDLAVAIWTDGKED